MEKDCKSTPQDTVDATPRDATGRESVPSAPTEEEGRKGRPASCGESARTSNSSNPSEPFEPLEPSDYEERIRRDCRRICRRNLFVELLKTVAKVAGVILAAMGLSSFNEEDSPSRS